MRFIRVVQVSAPSFLHYLVWRLDRPINFSMWVSDRHFICWITLVHIKLLLAAIFAAGPFIPVSHTFDLEGDGITYAFCAGVESSRYEERMKLAAPGVRLSVEETGVWDVSLALGVDREGF